MLFFQIIKKIYYIFMESFSWWIHDNKTYIFQSRSYIMIMSEQDFCFSCYEIWIGIEFIDLSIVICIFDSILNYLYTDDKISNSLRK